MPVDLVICRLKKRTLFLRRRCRDRAGRHNPNADTLLAPRVKITGIFERHLGIGGVETAGVLVRQTAFAPYKNLPKRPLI
ncbi:uncharacterized protein METZ01_LOCUS91294 [marine metagenome]|uniref:Uncharacterized protein n=1 Tax=marine metagenome TaxID=408172 RepID=A0A381VDN3_9ZZZZ